MEWPKNSCMTRGHEQLPEGLGVLYGGGQRGKIRTTVIA